MSSIFLFYHFLFFNDLQHLFQVLSCFACFLYFFFLFRHTGSMWEFLGQGWNLHHTVAARAKAVRTQEPQPGRPSENSLSLYFQQSYINHFNPAIKINLQSLGRGEKKKDKSYRSSLVAYWLRIQCCHCCGSGCCCSSGLIPGPGISTCCGYGQKNDKAYKV